MVCRDREGRIVMDVRSVSMRHIVRACFQKTNSSKSIYIYFLHRKAFTEQNRER